MGGLLMIIGAILEWVIGNSFSSVVFFTFGGFWFSYGATLVPGFSSYAAYAPPDAESVAEGLESKGWNASIGESNVH